MRGWGAQGAGSTGLQPEATDWTGSPAGSRKLDVLNKSSCFLSEITSNGSWVHVWTGSSLLWHLVVQRISSTGDVNHSVSRHDERPHLDTSGSQPPRLRQRRATSWPERQEVLFMEHNQTLRGYIWIQTISHTHTVQQAQVGGAKGQLRDK